MFDTEGVFTRQFTPVDGGYIYYPSRSSGGKLVTNEEYERLLVDRRRAGGVVGDWKTLGIGLVVILAWTFVSRWLALPAWTDELLIAFAVAALSGWLLWASFAPSRLVKNRPDITPPRSLSEARRAALAVMGWPLLVFMLLLSGAVFYGVLSSPDRTIAWTAWAVGSGLFFVVSLWTAIEKVRDRRR